MRAEKELETIGIKSIRELKIEEKNIIIKNFAEKMVETLKNENLKYDTIIEKMLLCRMYLAKFDSSLGTANYFYKNQTIYFNEKFDLYTLDEYSIHECIHYFQDTRERGKLDKIGLCTFSEFKIDGLGLNEGAVQYITSKMLDREKEEIQIGNIIIKTHSKNYYPLLCNLIEQIVFLIGEKELIDSTLFGNERFQIKFIKLCGEKALNNVENSFDKVLNIKNKISYENDQKMDKLEQAYEEAQNTIMLSYFDGVFPLLETIQEIEEYKQKLLEYKDKIGNIQKFDFYEMYKEKQLKEIDKKILKISRKNSINTPLVIHKNLIIDFFNKIRNIFSKSKKEYKF